MFKHILIPTDGSERAQSALRSGIDLAAAHGAKVTLLTVTPPLRAVAFAPRAAIDDAGYEELSKRTAEERLRPWAAYAREQGVKAEVRHVVMDPPADAILETARRKGCDLVVMASHGRRGFEALLLGSETQRVLTRAKVPVLVHR